MQLICCATCSKPQSRAPATLHPFLSIVLGHGDATVRQAAPVYRPVRLQIRAGESQRSPSVTKKRSTGPPFLPPVSPKDGGGGGGNNWGSGKLARNLALNALGLAIYMLLDGGGGGGGFGFGGGRGGGGGGGGGGSNFDPNRPQITSRDLDSDDEEEDDVKPKRRRRHAQKRLA